MRTNPNDHDALVIRGTTRYQKGEYIKAIDDFTQAIQSKPNDIIALYKRGSAFDKIGHLSQVRFLEFCTN